MADSTEHAIAIASASPIRTYRWKNRGHAPTGYVKGIAVAFQHTLCGLRNGEKAALAAVGDPSKDVLVWYASQLPADGTSDQERLVRLFTIMLRLGMREGSDRRCEGRDVSANNVSAESAEACLFQVSHDSIGSHFLLGELFDAYRGRDDLGSIFAEGVHYSQNAWKDRAPNSKISPNGARLSPSPTRPSSCATAASIGDLSIVTRPRCGRRRSNSFRQSKRCQADRGSALHRFSKRGLGMSKLEVSDEIRPFVDQTAESAEVQDLGDGRILLTTKGEDGGQVLLRRGARGLEIEQSDNVVERDKTFAAARRCAGACSAEQHAAVAAAIIAQVDRFSSAKGPDGGNLACVWSVRHIVHDALDFWITQSDGSVFGEELKFCFGHGSDETAIAPGGIVISPTEGRNIGHVGLLGTGRGSSRLIYSNSSAAARWKQNHTIQSWEARYVDRKHLKMLFFPLPRFGS